MAQIGWFPNPSLPASSHTVPLSCCHNVGSWMPLLSHMINLCSLFLVLSKVTLQQLSPAACQLWRDMGFTVPSLRSPSFPQLPGLITCQIAREPDSSFKDGTILLHSPSRKPCTKKIRLIIYADNSGFLVLSCQ